MSANMDGRAADRRREGKIGVLVGGPAGRRELSLRSGEAIHAALGAAGYDAVLLFADRDVDQVLRAARVDLVFLALAGRYGEGGCVQGLLELMGIPYTGSSPLAAALAADKAKAKELFRLHNLATPAGWVYRRGDGAVADRHGGFGFPAVVKPRRAGAGLGVRRVDEVDELESAVEEALRFDDEVLIERHVEGLLLHVLCLGGEALGAAERLDTDGGVYGLAGRLAGGLVTPPRLGAERLRGAMTIAARAAQALGTTGLCEVEVLVSTRGNEHVLSVDPQPLLVPGAAALAIARAGGLGLPDLVDACVREARLHVPISASALDHPELLGLAAEGRALSSEPH